MSRTTRHQPHRPRIFFHENSRWVLTTTDDRNVRLWDNELDDWLLTLNGHTDLVKVVVSLTENYLATASGLKSEEPPSSY